MDHNRQKAGDSGMRQRKGRWGWGVIVKEHFDEPRPVLLPHLVDKIALISGLLAVAWEVLILFWPGKSHPSVVDDEARGGMTEYYLVVSGVAQVAYLSVQPDRLRGQPVLLFVSGAGIEWYGRCGLRHFGRGLCDSDAGHWIGVGFVFRGVATTSPLSVTHAASDGEGDLLRRSYDPARIHRAGVSFDSARHH